MSMMKTKPETVSFITTNPKSDETNWEVECLSFTVPYEWAVEYCGSEEELNKFYWECTTDETTNMYGIALLENAIVSEKIIKDFWGN